MQQLGESECKDIDKFDASAKTWVNDFVTLYQTKDMTPYMHAFSMHVSQFLSLHGNIHPSHNKALKK